MIDNNWVMNFIILIGGIMTSICFSISLSSAYGVCKKRMDMKSKLNKAMRQFNMYSGCSYSGERFKVSNLKSEKLYAEIRKIRVECKQLNFKIKRKSLEINEMISMIKKITSEDEEIENDKQEKKINELKNKVKDAKLDIEKLEIERDNLVSRIQSVQLKMERFETEQKKLISENERKKSEPKDIKVGYRSDK